MSKIPVRISLVLALASAAVLAVAVVPALVVPAWGDDDAAPEPVAGIKNVMNALNHEQTGFYGMIRSFCTANPDAGDEGWKVAGHRAILMAEGANVLMGQTPPKGGDDEAGMKAWRVQCAQFREACKELRKALAFKKADKVKAALDAVAARCDACHAAHRN
jgi:hypothetical protein